MKKNKGMHIKNILISNVDILIPRERNAERHEWQASHIAKYGQLHPIKVIPNPRKNGKKYLLVYGQGRLESAAHLGKKKIETTIDHEMSYIEAVEQWFTENVVRRELTAYDKAKVLKQLHDIGISIRDLAKRFCISPAYTKMLLRVFEKGSPKIHEQLQVKGPRKIQMAHAVRIVGSFDNFNDQEAIVRTLRKLGIHSQKTVEIIIEKAKNLKYTDTKISTEKLIKALRNIEIELRDKTDKYYTIFHQKELLEKAYTKLVKDKQFRKLAHVNQIALL